MKAYKLNHRRSDLFVVEGLQKVKLSFPGMTSLLDFVEEIKVTTIEFNRKESTLICKCTAQESLLAQVKYKAKLVSPK